MSTRMEMPKSATDAMDVVTLVRPWTGQIHRKDASVAKGAQLTAEEIEAQKKRRQNGPVLSTLSNAE